MNFLKKRVASSPAAWKVLANQVMAGYPLEQGPPDRRFTYRIGRGEPSLLD